MMTDKAGEHIGDGIAWAGFWLFLGLSFFGGCSFEDIKEVMDGKTERGEEQVQQPVDGSEVRELHQEPAEVRD